MNSIKLRVMSLFAVLFLFPLILLGGGGSHVSPDLRANHLSMAAWEAGDCLSLCTGRAQAPDVLPGQKEREIDHEPKPRPEGHYYLQFAAYNVPAEPASRESLLKYFKWQPPDLFRLYANFRM